MTSNFPGYNSSFHSSASPRRSNRQNNVKVISKRLSEAKECRNCVRVRNWFRLLFAPENSKVLLNPRSPSPRTGHHNYCPLVNHDGRQLAGGRNRDWGPQIHQNMQLFILEAFLAFKCYLNKLKIQILAHQEAFWGSNSFTSSWVPFLEARFLEFIFHVTCFA